MPKYVVWYVVFVFIMKTAANVLETNIDRKHSTDFNKHETAYDHYIQSCSLFKRIEIVKYAYKTIAECKSLYSARLDCLAFNCSVHHGGSG